jgi:hypothetical protein
MDYNPDYYTEPNLCNIHMWLPYSPSQCDNNLSKEIVEPLSMKKK